MTELDTVKDDEKELEEIIQEAVITDEEELVIEQPEEKIVSDTQDMQKALDSIKIEKPKLVEVEDSSSKLTKELYEEFNVFLKKTVGITPDTGTKEVIPTGIDLLDAILGGGFAIGALNIIVGQPGAGKSMLAGRVIASGQRIYKEKLISAYLDSEHATTKIRLANLGVTSPMLKPYSDITVEKVFQFLEGVCLFKEMKNLEKVPSVVVWDSIANTLSQREKEIEDINSVIGYKARLLSILIPKYVSKCSSFNICFIAVNQLRDVLQMGPYAQAKDLKFMTHSKDMPGGNILKYNAFHLIEMKVKAVVTSDKLYGFDGVEVNVNCVKNKLFTPNIPVPLVASFSNGFSNFWTNYKYLVDSKRIHAGAWNYLNSMPDKKFRTKDVEKLYNEDSTFKAEFDKNVKDTIQTEIIDKHAPDIS